jgi:hypothetical protein
VNLEQFHHGIRAARNVLRHQGGTGDLVVMGSQSILASYPVLALSPALLMSAEIDIMPVATPSEEIERLSDYLHGALGQDSKFQEAHGFHIDGITIDTAVLPTGWTSRLIPAVDPSSQATGWCLDPHDLAAAKVIAGRPKDIDFVNVMVISRLIDPQLVIDRLRSVDDVRSKAAMALVASLLDKGLPDEARASWRKGRQQAVLDRLSRTSESSPASVIEQLRQLRKGESG